MVVIIKGQGDSGQADLGAAVLKVCKMERKKKGKEANEVCSRHMPGNRSVNNMTGHSLADHGINKQAISAETGCFKTSHPPRFGNEVVHIYFFIFLISFLSPVGGIASCFLRTKQTNMWICSSPNLNPVSCTANMELPRKSHTKSDWMEISPAGKMASIDVT